MHLSNVKYLQPTDAWPAGRLGTYEIKVRIQNQNKIYLQFYNIVF